MRFLPRLPAMAALAPFLVVASLAAPARAQDNTRSDEALRVLDAMRGYLEVVDRYSQIAMDPGASGVAAVVAASEIYRARSPEEAISFFNGMLPQVKNEAVQRAIRIQLSELYRVRGQNDKALEQLKILMTSAPAEPPRAPYSGPTPPTGAPPTGAPTR